MSAAPERFDALLDDATIAAALHAAVGTGQSALEALEARAGLEPEALAAALAASFDYRYVSAAELAGLPPRFEILSATDAAQRRCAIVGEPGQPLAVIADPFDAELRPWLELKSAAPLAWALAGRADLEAYLARHQQGLRAIDTALPGAGAQHVDDGVVHDLSLLSISHDSSPIVKLVHSTVYDALRAGASDIHLETTGGGLAVRYRIDGVLVHIAAVPGIEVSEQVISRIKVMSDLDIAERRVPQDGRFKIAIEGRPIDFRVSVIPSVFGEDAVLRVLDKQTLTRQMNGLRLDVLGFEADVIQPLRRLSALPYGMLLVTGPTGSGKTTTLYAAISETHTGLEKIVTIEDPVEYQLPGVLQIPVNEKKGLTFARGLRSILRHDPDKIMVGEIRDPETAQIAIQSALTGHLVFTTVHANNVFDVMSRFTHMGIDTYSFVAALSGILAQRLVRLVCTHCAAPVVPDPALLRDSKLDPDEVRDFEFRIGSGCGHCRGTGYRGRKAIGELLVLDDELREAIIARVPTRQLKELALRGGMRLIRTTALGLVRRGETSLEEVNRVTVMA
ncbi:MAG: type II/IV secretion system protein [Gammaproteobacteria bacterium]|nr:type II/IV secretion system protein [Gammaproteobacteria bacterium]